MINQSSTPPLTPYLNGVVFVFYMDFIDNTTSPMSVNADQEYYSRIHCGATQSNTIFGTFIEKIKLNHKLH